MRRKIRTGLAGLVLALAGCSDSVQSREQIYRVGEVYRNAIAYREDGTAVFAPNEERNSLYEQVGDVRKKMFELPEGYIVMGLASDKRFSAAVVAPEAPNLDESKRPRLLIFPHNGGALYDASIPSGVSASSIINVKDDSVFVQGNDDNVYRFDVNLGMAERGKYPDGDVYDLRGKEGEVYREDGLWYLKMKK